MNSFNVYGQTTETIGGSTPVWLGTVKPIPVGAMLEGGFSGDTHYPAGSAVEYEPETKTIATIHTTLEGVSMENINGFLYNDIYGKNDGDATAAIVMHHPEGLLIERVYPEITEEQIAALQKAIPGVLLVRG